MKNFLFETMGSEALTYDPHMRVALMAQLDMQAKLQVAVGHAELELNYQPIVELKTGVIVGFEALLRWRHPQRGIIAPAEFIPIAEATGMILGIGRWALEQACQQLARWRQLEPALTMNVNVSVHQLRDRGFPADLGQVLLDTHLPGHALTLEISESVLIDDEELTIDSLRRLKEMGVTIALDDFGTGYSSLGYLQKFPIDILKIDRSFVSGAASESGGAQLIRTIIELGRAYDLDVVAVGIENEAQRSWLLDLGCHRGQGYRFGRPTDAAGVDAQLAARGVSRQATLA